MVGLASKPLHVFSNPEYECQWVSNLNSIRNNIKSVLDSLSDHTQFTIEQMPMSDKLCVFEDYSKIYKKWGFEKLVYRDVKGGIHRDRKYAAQPRNVYAARVQLSQNLAGKTTYKTEGRIKYFHYRGTINTRHEPCIQLINATEAYVDHIPYVMDTTMVSLAGSVEEFEIRMIGDRLQKTRQ